MEILSGGTVRNKMEAENLATSNVHLNEMNSYKLFSWIVEG